MVLIGPAPAIAGVELGGTKCNLVLAGGPDDIRGEARIPTMTPGETLAAIEAVLDEWRGLFAAIGIASFGPVAIDPAAPDYGSITATTKPGWSHTDIARRIEARYGVPVGFHSDVTGAALGEGRWGAARGVADHAYITIGTGVGVGLISNGRPIAGMSHPELGHMMPQRLAGDDWPGNCPFHGACVEGLVAGPAIAARTGMAGDAVPDDHPIWAFAAHTIAQLCHTLVMTGIPRRILIGGGVGGSRRNLLPRIRSALGATIGDYRIGAELDDLETYLVPAALGDRSGSLGATLLPSRILPQI